MKPSKQRKSSILIMNELAQTLIVFLNYMQRSLAVDEYSFRKQNIFVKSHHVYSSKLGEVAFNLVLSQPFKVKFPTEGFLIAESAIEHLSELVDSSLRFCSFVG